MTFRELTRLVSVVTALSVLLVSLATVMRSPAARSAENRNTVDSSSITSMAGHRGVCTQCHRSDTSAQYVIDPARSRVQFKVGQSGGALPEGLATQLRGGFKFDPTAIGHDSVAIAIPAASLELPSSLLSNLLKSERFLSADRYPEIRFESTSIASKDNTEFELGGILTLHGLRHPQRLRATFVDGGADPLTGRRYARFHASGQFLRSEFNLSFAPKALPDEVNVEMDIIGLRATP